MTDPINFRALCVNLLDCLEKADWPPRYRNVFGQWASIARVALAEPGTQKLARHPDGTPMVSIGKAVPVGDWERLASDPDHSRACMVGRPAPPAPPAEGEVAELVAWLHGQDGGLGRRAIYARIAELLERHAAPVPVPVSERPWEREGWCDMDGECWWCPPVGPAYWNMVNPAIVYGGWLLPHWAIHQPPQGGEVE